MLARMKPGQESRTAVLVCMGRAVAHGITPVPRFSDPTALALLPASDRERVERHRAGQVEAGVRGRLRRKLLAGLSLMMVPRTVAIDDAVRAAAAPQLVILGAGLDGRAFRMEELRGVTVFEVDHPESQRAKRERAAALRPMGEVRFVPVDFTRDDLDAALAAAGHDAARATAWIWEGVVMYLTRAEIEATLTVVARRSAPASRLIVGYRTPSPLAAVTALVLRLAGEPNRSAFTAGQIGALLARHGFKVTSDEDLAAIAGRLSAEVRPRMRSLRIATADRAA